MRRWRVIALALTLLLCATAVGVGLAATGKQARQRTPLSSVSRVGEPEVGTQAQDENHECPPDCYAGEQP